MPNIQLPKTMELRPRVLWELGVGSWELPAKSSILRQHVEVLANGLGESDEDRVANQGVSDRHLVEVRKAPEDHEVIEVEIVSGVHADAKGMRVRGRFRVLAERGVRRLDAALERARVWLGVQLDAIGAKLRGPLHGREQRINEKAHSNTVGLQVTDGPGESVARCIG